jgi:hypothetical protein
MDKKFWDESIITFIWYDKERTENDTIREGTQTQIAGWTDTPFVFQNKESTLKHNP